MKTFIVGPILVLGLTVLPTESLGQGVDVGVSGVALLSIQPRDDTFTTGPYLNEGQGGFGPAWGAGLSVIAPARFAVVGEFTTAQFQMVQAGRLISGFGADELADRISEWRDSLLSGLVGYVHPWGNHTRLLYLGGVSMRTGELRIDGEVKDVDTSKVGVTGGVDVLRMFGTRSALVISARYSFIDRKDMISYGIGPHVFRIGAGIRLRIN